MEREGQEGGGAEDDEQGEKDGDGSRQPTACATVDELTDELANTIPGGNDVDEFIDDTVLRESLNAFLATLPEETRNVFVRRYWYMDSVERIAEGYGMSESKVKSMLFRCRNKLRQTLQKEGYNL